MAIRPAGVNLRECRSVIARGRSLPVANPGRLEPPADIAKLMPSTTNPPTPPAREKGKGELDRKFRDRKMGKEPDRIIREFRELTRITEEGPGSLTQSRKAAEAQGGAGPQMGQNS